LRLSSFMNKLIEVDSPKGTVLVAIRAAEGSINPTADLEETIEKVGGSVDDAFKVVESVVASFNSRVKKFGDALTDAEIEMGLGFTAKGSVYVIEAEAEATFKVTLKFKLR
jgi:hypothetical protein